MTASSPLRLEIRGLTKTFAGTRALDGVDLDLRPGEVHALLGQNGSGKSTLIKVLAGFHAPDPGASIRLDGESVQIGDTTHSRDLGLRFVHQDLGLVLDLNTIENLALGGGFDTAFGGRIRWRDERRRAQERMRALGYEIDVRRPVRELEAAERTGVAIARALDQAEAARVLVVDEPTASLPLHEVQILFAAIDRVRKLGLSVLYVSHRLDEIFEIADRVTILRDGNRVATYDIAALDRDRLVSLMVGGQDLAARADRVRHGDDVALDVRGLCGTVLAGVDLRVHSGEVVGLAGLTGSGREAALRAIFGDLPRRGSVRVVDEVIPAGKPHRAIRAGMALVPADRHARGSITTLRVDENCTLTDLRRHSHGPARLSRRREREEVDGWITALDVRPKRSDAPFATLSGGNQQKIVLAKWLRLKPRVLLLDEPTQGVDVHAKALIHALARQAATDGAAVIIASSDDTELCDVCDRVLVLRDGEVAAELSGAALTPEAIGHLQLAEVANA